MESQKFRHNTDCWIRTHTRTKETVMHRSVLGNMWVKCTPKRNWEQVLSELRWLLSFSEHTPSLITTFSGRFTLSMLDTCIIVEWYTSAMVFCRRKAFTQYYSVVFRIYFPYFTGKLWETLFDPLYVSFMELKQSFSTWISIITITSSCDQSLIMEIIELFRNASLPLNYIMGWLLPLIAD